MVSEQTEASVAPSQSWLAEYHRRAKQTDRNAGLSSKRFSPVAKHTGVRSAASRPGDARSATELGLASLLLPVGSFAANVVFARTLGASGRGDLAAIIAALAVCEGVLAFGIPDILARHISKGSLPTGAHRYLAAGAVAASLIPGTLIGLYCHSRHFSWPVAAFAGLVVPVTRGSWLGAENIEGLQAR
jgi:hypothetical protein